MVLQTSGAIEGAPLQACEVALPVPGPGQVRLRVLTCGVCHTDLHTVEGELALPHLPLIPGHQIVGQVDALGSDTSHLVLGQRVGVGWLGWVCGACEFCRRGLENLCLHARFTGLHLDGGYAEYTVVDERFAYPLPERFTNAQAAPLLCAGVIGYRSLRLSGIQPGGRLGLYGFGASAHIAIQVARYWGCEVYVFTRGAEHRKLAQELGAAWTGAAEETPPQMLDAAITFAPAGSLVPLALGHLRPGSTLAINAVTMSDIPTLSYVRLYGERVVRSVANLTRHDAEEFLPLAAAIPVHSEVEIFALEQANAVLKRLKQGGIRGSAVLQVVDRAV